MSVSVGSSSTSASPGKQGDLPKDREVGPGPPAYDEISLLIRVASSLAADREVELRTCLPSCLAEVTTAARAGLRRGEYAAVCRVNSGRPNWVVEKELPKIAFFLGCPVARVYGPVREPRKRNLCIRRRNLQFINCSHLLVDELAQLGGAVALSGDDSAKVHKQNPERSRTRDRRPE